MTSNVSRTSLLWYSLYYFTDTLGYNPSALLIKALNESLCLTLVFSLLWPHKGSLKETAIYPSFYHLITNEIQIKLNHNLWSALNNNELKIKADIKKRQGNHSDELTRGCMICGPPFNLNLQQCPWSPDYYSKEGKLTEAMFHMWTDIKNKNQMTEREREPVSCPIC